MGNVFDKTTTEPALPPFVMPFSIDSDNTTGLNLAVFGGTTILTGAVVPSAIANTALVLNNNATNYISLNLVAGTIVNDGAAVVPPHAPIYAITTLAGAIISVVDLRIVYYPAAGITANNTVLTGITSIEQLLTSGVLNIGHATDTTLARVSAGTLAIEGANILTTLTGAAEEIGNWTPTAIFSGGNGDLAYSLQIGKYRKHGKAYLCTFYLVFLETTASGSLAVGGLPAAATAAANARSGFGLVVDGMTGVTGAVMGTIVPGAVSFGVNQSGTGTASNVTAANTAAAGSYIVGSFTYFVD